MKKASSLIVIVIWAMFWVWVGLKVLPYYSMDYDGTFRYLIKSLIVLGGNMVISLWLIARVFGFSFKELFEELKPEE